MYQFDFITLYSLGFGRKEEAILLCFSRGFNERTVYLGVGKTQQGMGKHELPTEEAIIYLKLERMRVRMSPESAKN